MWRKNEIVGDHPVLVSSLDNVPDLDKYGVRGVVLYGYLVHLVSLVNDDFLLVQSLFKRKVMKRARLDPAFRPGRSVMVNQKDGETFMRVRS